MWGVCNGGHSAFVMKEVGPVGTRDLLILELGLDAVAQRLKPSG
jgi:hypothetical protein